MEKQSSKTNWKNIEKEFEKEFAVEFCEDDKRKDIGKDFASEVHAGDIIDFFERKHQALIKELGEEIKKMKIEGSREGISNTIDLMIKTDREAYNFALSDIKELLKRYEK